MISISKQNEAVIGYLERGKYQSLNALYYLRNFSGADVYLYNGDIENGVIVGAEEQDFFYLNTYDPGFMREFWETLPPGHKCFSGVPRLIADVFMKDTGAEWTTPGRSYALRGEYRRVDDARYADDRLILSDAEEVNEYYTYKSEDSLDRIRQCIMLRDSSCVRIDGRLAAWCAVHLEDSSMGPLYTKGEYRGLGLAALVTSRLMEKLIAKNYLPYMQIVEDNDTSMHVADKISGIAYTHDSIWFGVEK